MICSKSTKMYGLNLLMFYSESELIFSNFFINLLSSISKSKSESESDDSESDFNSVFINFDICVFLPYIYTLLNKLADDFFIKIHNRINSHASNASIMHIFFKNHLKEPQTNIITRINISITINQINKHKAKIYNHCMYTHNYYQKCLLFFFTEYKNKYK